MQERKERNLGRWFRLLTALQGGGRPNAAELAQRYGVTVRTVYRDLAALEELNVPIIREGGRYWLPETYRVRPVQFTPEEVMALVAALDFGARRRSIGGSAAQSALEKLTAVMPGPQKEMVAGLEENLVVDPLPGHSLDALPGISRTLQGALQGGHPLRLSYQALAAAQPSERTVRPYGLAYRGTGLYLIGYCELRQDIRTFRVNRIAAAEVLPDRFERPAGFDLERFLTRVWGIEDGPELQVRVRFSPPVARLAQETVWHPSQSVTVEPDGTALLLMRTRGKHEIARWLAGYGGTVEVLEPPELREAVLALGRGIVGRYG